MKKPSLFICSIVAALMLFIAAPAIANNVDVERFVLYDVSKDSVSDYAATKVDIEDSKANQSLDRRQRISSSYSLSSGKYYNSKESTYSKESIALISVEPGWKA